ncbi:bifunctional tetrahydrofolate synthase/dihydrofolate synthase [Legionella sp. MW5194]|uniref:bifunctional tetrahydrofolate synthase/dihydrofolate synthase n=1 Tax=Legionella sp. MW5194 TaxID=2662448 RepID=UPI00193CB619|nr:bifunctional tetrahydrofolate synthase/dihydrofolate synthase [Legionella sp. MW5194]QRN03763.1 bifunctional tetrahydrofolate synthase/dihydrofolate synthase [Legionella sp. MW5194]
MTHATDYRSWSLEHWLTVLESRHKKEIQLGLARIARVAGQLDLLRPHAKVITVAGTNGKGSTVASLEALYRSGGYQIGAYTSPHVLHFNERIRINGVPVSDEALTDAFSVIEEGRGETHLTYFETATLAALYLFQQTPLDLIILEVGIGGRLDATNIIDADLAIITTIDYDHQDYLGDTLEKIGAEKAGILREGKPVIYADVSPPLSILSAVHALRCPHAVNGQHYRYRIDQQQLTFTDSQGTLHCREPFLHGNALAAAMMTTRYLHDHLPVTPAQITEGLSGLTLKGRQQVIETGHHTVLFDVSHNPQAAAYLADHLVKQYSGRRIHAVFSALGDKDLTGIIAPLSPWVACWYPALLQSKRAATSEQLLQAFANHGIDDVLCHNSPSAAYKTACQQASAGDLILVYGSFFTVCAVLPAVSNENLSEGV